MNEKKIVITNNEDSADTANCTLVEHFPKEIAWAKANNCFLD